MSLQVEPGPETDPLAELNRRMRHLAEEWIKSKATDEAQLRAFVGHIMEASVRDWVREKLTPVLRHDAQRAMVQKLVAQFIERHAEAYLETADGMQSMAEIGHVFKSADIIDSMTHSLAAKRALATRLSAAGYSSKQIAEQLGVPERQAVSLTRAGRSRSTLLLAELKLYYPETKLPCTRTTK